MTRIVIAGCGDVGSRLGILLVADGHQVWGLKRNPATLPPTLRPLAADLADPASLDLPQDVDYVVYAASAGGFTEQRYRAAYVDGVANLLAALEKTGQRPKRVILVSSTSVYAQDDGRWVDEDSPAEPEGFSGRCLREGEDLLWNNAYPATVIRFGGIYGPGRTRLLDSVRRGEARCVEGVFSNRIHSEDCAAALRHVLLLPEPAPLYIGVDDAPAPLCDVLRWLGERLGVAPPAVVAETEQTTAGRGLRSNKRLSNARLKATGFRFRYPSYREGYQALLGR